jgi:hypothetical protein
LKTAPNTASTSTQATAKQHVINELAVLARELLPWLLLEEASSCSSSSTSSTSSSHSGKPPDILLARDLYRFLTIKRDHPDANVSPAPLVDQLWHSLLLETDLAAAVHASLGVETVRHSLMNSARRA